MYNDLSLILASSVVRRQPSTGADSMSRSLAPVMFEDDNRQRASRKRDAPVEKAEVYDSAKRKSNTKRTEKIFNFFGNQCSQPSFLQSLKLRRWPKIMMKAPIKARTYSS